MAQDGWQSDVEREQAGHDAPAARVARHCDRHGIAQREGCGRAAQFFWISEAEQAESRDLQDGGQSRQARVHLADPKSRRGGVSLRLPAPPVRHHCAGLFSSISLSTASGATSLVISTIS